MGPRSIKNNKGYVVDFNNDFFVLQEIDDFNVYGYSIYPLQSITEIRHNHNDKYYNKIMLWEGITDKMNYPHKVDLTSWSTIFQSIKTLGFNVIIENENPEDNTFDIGPIVKVTDKSVRLRYFNAEGYLADDTTKIKWKYITRVQFDNRYINVFSKYLRERK